MNRLKNKTWLGAAYVINKRTLVDIGNEINVSPGIVIKYCRAFGIPIRRYGVSLSVISKLENYKWLLNQYINKNKSLKQISEELSTSQWTVSKYLKKHNIRKSSHLEKIRNKSWLFNEYQIKGISIEQISKNLSVTKHTIKKYLKKYNIDIRPEFVNHKIFNLLNDPTWLHQHYIINKETIRHLSNILSIKPDLIKKYLKKHNINIRKKPTSNPISIKKLKNKDWLTHEHVIKERSINNIANDLSVNPRIVFKFCRKHNIKTSRLPRRIFNKLNNKKWLSKEYISNKKSATMIATELGIYYGTVLSFCRKYGFKIRPNNHVSKEEISIIEFIKGLNFNTISNNRSVLEGKEIDILVPDKNFGIELNGLYWHSYNPTDHRRKKVERCAHKEKYELAKKKKIDLMFITDYEWNHKQDIIKSLISNYLDANIHISSDSTTFKEINHDEAKPFFNKNHLLGFIKGSKYYGLFYQNKLMLSMITNRDENPTIILRFAHQLNHFIDGGLAKIIRMSKIKYLTLKSDIMKENNKIFKNSGFIISNLTSEDYIWTNGPDIISKNKYTSLSKQNKKQFGKYYNCGYIIRTFKS